MHTLLDMIHNFGNGLHYIGLEADKLYKFVSKKVREAINMILTKCTGDDLIDYKVYGISKQNATTGKNKANPNEFVKGRLDNGVIGYASGTSSIEYSEPTLTVETNTLYRGFVSNLIELATSNFFVSFSSSTNAVCKIAYYDESENFISQSEYNSLDNVNGKKITKPTNAKYFRFSIEYQAVGTFTLSNIQVEENSSSATAYEPYTGGIASPNPNYPQEIQSVGDLVTSGEHAGKYKIPIKISGINKAKVVDCELTGSNYSLSVSKGIVEVETRASNSAFDLCSGTRVGQWLPNYANANDYHLTSADKETYIIKPVNLQDFDIEGTGNTTIAVYTNKRMLSAYITFNGELWSATVSLQDDEYIKSIYLWTNGNNNLFKGKFSIQLQKSNDNTYEPYHEPVIKDIYLDEPIRKTNNVSDYIDFKNQKDVRSLKRVVLNGSEDWQGSISGNYMTVYLSLANLKPAIDNDTLANIMSDKFGTITRNQWYSAGILKEGIAVAQSGVLCCKVLKSRLANETITGFKNWLSSNNVTLDFETITPTEETIDLPEIPTFEGTTIIEVDTEVQPSNMWFQYYAKE